MDGLSDDFLLFTNRDGHFMIDLHGGDIFHQEKQSKNMRLRALFYLKKGIYYHEIILQISLCAPHSLSDVQLQRLCRTS